MTGAGIPGKLLDAILADISDICAQVTARIHVRVSVSKPLHDAKLVMFEPLPLQVWPQLPQRHAFCPLCPSRVPRTPTKVISNTIR